MLGSAWNIVGRAVHLQWLPFVKKGRHPRKTFPRLVRRLDVDTDPAAAARSLPWRSKAPAHRPPNLYWGRIFMAAAHVA